MSSVLVVTVAFTTDEAEFLATVLTRLRDAAVSGSAEGFWLDRLHARIRQDLMDVVANDSAARLAASSAPAGFGLPPAPPPVPHPFPAPQAVAMCTCGGRVGSALCHNKRTAGTHP